MPRTAEALSHGAVTIVNAMASGKGAALGVKLWTRAKITVTSQAGSFVGRNVTDPKEDTSLIETVARRVFQSFRVDRRFGALVETRSNIPVAVGLKSSSAASNAVALASLRALRRKATDIQTVKLGVEASLQAGVTLTGAYDDACACYFGGIVATDNGKRRIIKRFKPDGRLRVLVHVPPRKKYTNQVDPQPLRKIRTLVELAQREVLRGNYWNSLTLNGLAYSTAFGYDTRPARQALSAGAVAAGLSGKGPAVVAIVPASNVNELLSAWRGFSGRIIQTSFNFQKARVLGVGE
jgi:shikimate kinase